MARIEHPRSALAATVGIGIFSVGHRGDDDHRVVDGSTAVHKKHRIQLAARPNRHWHRGNLAFPWLDRGASIHLLPILGYEAIFGTAGPWIWDAHHVDIVE